MSVSIWGLMVAAVVLAVPTRAVGTVDIEVVSFSAPSEVAPGEPIGDQIHLRIRNTGPGDIYEGFFVGFYISTDDRITLTDQLLIGGREWVAALAAGGEVDVPLFAGAYVPADYPLGPAYLGAIVDEFDHVIESDETNNTAASAVFVGGGVPAQVCTWGAIKQRYR